MNQSETPRLSGAAGTSLPELVTTSGSHPLISIEYRVLMPPAKDQAPRKPRYSVTLTASAIRAGYPETTEHSVQNLSEDGACVQSGEVFQVGEKLVITIGNLMAVSAEVRWIVNDLAGMKFTRAISIADALGYAARPPKMPKSSLARRVPLAVDA